MLSSYRSHRQLGEQMGLFHFPIHSPGMAFWHSPGLAIYHALEDYCRELGKSAGYEEVRSPLVCNHSLWEKSGHADKFSDKMFNLQVDERLSALKPMNCPGHAELYALRPRSYRELPLRISELGHVHRLEQSGELNGLLRARSFVIDDAHLFCLPSQVEEELAKCLAMAKEVYEALGLSLQAELSLRPEKRLGDDALWDKAEDGLRRALSSSDISYQESPGEGAFYGPKVDLHVEDSLGRSWQMGSVQLDFQLPIRFDLRYIDSDGKDSKGEEPNRPVMIHRAMFGSLERLIGILLEHYQGNFPLWMSPMAVHLLPVGEEDYGYCKFIESWLARGNIRAQIIYDGGLGKRIHSSKKALVPVVAVIGKKERENESLALNVEGQKIDLSFSEFSELMYGAVSGRALKLPFADYWEMVQALPSEPEHVDLKEFEV